MLQIISEQTLNIDEEVCACFIGWQKAFDHVNWSKLIQILEWTCNDLCERTLIRKLYMDQNVKVWLDQGDTRHVKIGREGRQGCCLSWIWFNLYSKCLTKEVLEGFEYFKIVRQVICTVKHADGLVLQDKDYSVL